MKMTRFEGLVPFWDPALFDTEKGDLYPTVNQPRREGTSLVFDAPWEGNGTDYGSIVREDGFFRLYYETWSDANWYDPNEPFCIHVCYAESVDGIHFTKPKLGMVELDGSADNNVIIESIPDNFTVMKDDNPSCPPKERYKALVTLKEQDYRNGDKKNVLGLWVSEDGIRFTQHSIISRGHAYDTQNTLHYDRHTSKYYCYIRSYEDKDPNIAGDARFSEERIRHIRVMESSDLVHWSDPKLLDFGDVEDYPLYTNCVCKYPYDDRYAVGFPTRYVERRAWGKGFDDLCGKELRRRRCAAMKRLGLALSDTLFMFSYGDRHRFHRFEEATLAPGPEMEKNWVYGDCYTVVGAPVITPAPVKGEPDELSVYVFARHFMDVPSELVRYVYRKDGFASVKAPYKGGRLVTKPFIFHGSDIFLNMSTSARGCIYVSVLDANGDAIDGYASPEMFGDSVEKPVHFSSPLSSLEGKTVRLAFDMKDAQIYSMTVKK